MKKYIILPDKKGIDALEIKDFTIPKLKPNEVCVRVHATSLNYRDLITVNRGVNQELTPLSDGAGQVEATGDQVTSLKQGDRVLGLFFPLWQSGSIDSKKLSVARGSEPTHGMLSQYVFGPASSFLKIPEYLSYAEASTLPCSGVTAWNALVVQGRLNPGQTVVIQGTGGVALFALLVAKTIGAKTIVLSSSFEKLKNAQELGAVELINYKENPNWDEHVLSKTKGQGADLIIELGGAGTLEKSMAATKVNGRISMIGVLTGVDGLINPMPIIRKSLSVKGIYVGSRDMQRDFHRALQINRIHPVIDRIFKFGEVKEAYTYMESARHFGKIVIQMD